MNASDTATTHRLVASPVLEFLQPLDKLEWVDPVALEARLLEHPEAVLDPLTHHRALHGRVQGEVGGQACSGGIAISLSFARQL